jgi:lactate permease
MLMFLFAASPLLIILLLMAGLRWGLIRTGLAAWGWTLAVALLAFGADLSLIAASQAKALLTALDVLAVVWGALLFYAVCDQAGAVRVVGNGLSAVVPGKGLRALALAWAFASFLQGAGGFGVPVVITAPLLLTVGFTPMQSVLLPSIGHGWAVTFGSLGTSFQALMASSGLGPDALAAPSALLLGVLCLLSGMLVGVLAAENRGELLSLLPAILAIGGSMAAVQYLLAVGGFWQVAALGGGLAGLAAAAGLGILYHRRKSRRSFSPDRSFLYGLSAYLVLLAVVCSARWIGPLRDALESVEWHFSIPAVASSPGSAAAAGSDLVFAPLAHPGMLLAYAAAVVFLWFRILKWYGGGVGIVLRKTAERATPVSLGILMMTGVSMLLAYSGMTAQLAEGLSASVGAVFPAVAPWLGAAGAFLTGSNTNSNLLFAQLQQRTARALGVPEKILLAAQTAGGAVGSVVSPAKIGLGSIAFRRELREGAVMRRLLLPIGVLLAAGSACVLLMLWG